MKLGTLVLGSGAAVVALGWLGWSLTQGERAADVPAPATQVAEAPAAEPVNLFPPLEVPEETEVVAEEPLVAQEGSYARSGPGYRDVVIHPNGVITGKKMATMVYSDGTVREVELNFRAKRDKRPLAIVKRGPNGERTVVRPSAQMLAKQKEAAEAGAAAEGN